MWTLPVSILKFWYLQAPFRLISYFDYLNFYLINLFSLPLMVKTFFRPWKNEYRPGLIRFSIFMGMAFKTLLIIAGLFLLVLLVAFEIVTFIVFLLLPILAFVLPFIKI